MLRSLRVRLLALFSIVVTFAILIYIIYQGRDTLLTYDWQIDWCAVALAFGVLIATFAIVAFTWVAEMRAVGSTLPMSVHLDYYVASHLFRRLPGTIWYIAGRSYLYRQQGESARLVAVVSSLELVLLTVGAALVTVMLWVAGFQPVPGGYLWVLIATVGIGALLIQPRSSRWLLKRIGKVDAPQLRYSQLICWLFSYVVAWIGSGLIFYLLAYAFTGLGSEHLPYTIGAWALVGALSTLVFFLPSNFGFTEIGLTLLMTAVMPMSVAVVLALTVRVTLTAFDLLAVGLWFGGEAIWRRVNPDANLPFPPVNKD
ncbi:MAG TPA: hypothetical protein DCL15_08685 [Chloroflexi bacterium]|nr:hypothetical protein [Chloroflexota bacterium]HHW88815.1 hypothetical protein [Chloroflexota bacterium]